MWALVIGMTYQLKEIVLKNHDGIYINSENFNNGFLVGVEFKFLKFK